VPTTTTESDEGSRHSIDSSFPAPFVARLSVIACDCLWQTSLSQCPRCRYPSQSTGQTYCHHFRCRDFHLI
jgi:hypothetical protein